MIGKPGAYKNSFSLWNKIGRLLWGCCWLLFFRPFSGPIFRYWRSAFLRLWGAKIGRRCAIAASARVWAPWHLELGDYVAIGPDVEIYNVASVRMGSYITVSQKAYICTASHDITELLKPLVFKPIVIGDFCWICSRALIMPGLSIDEGSVVAAGAVVTKNVAPWTVVAGNPARFVKKRVLRENHEG